TGAGTLTLAGANTYTGATTINAGTLALQSTYASSGFSVASGAVLELNVASSGTTLDLATTTFSGAGTLRKTGAGTVQWGLPIATFALGAGSLIDVQAGTFTGGSNANDVWTNNKAGLNVASGATFKGVEANVIVDALTGAGTLSSGYSGGGYSQFTVGINNGSGTFSGTLQNDAAAAKFTKSGTGSQVLSGANTYTGATSVSAGSLALGAGGSLAASAVTVSSGGKFAIQQSAEGSTNASVNATFTLSAGSQLSMADGYATTLNLAGGASLAPASGTSPILSFDINGTSTDLLAITGAATVGAAGAKILINPPPSTVTAGTYSVITAASGLNTNFSLVSSLLAANNGLYMLSLGGSATAEQVTVAADANALYWMGAATDWNTAGNWTTDLAGTTLSGSAPGTATNVAFSASGAGSLTTTTLTGALTVNSLNFLSGASSVTVASSANALTLNGGGINSGSANAMTINNPVTLGAAQTWINAGAGLLTIGGAVTNGASNLAIAGSGNTTISGAIGSGTGTLTMNSTGTLTLSGATNNFTGATTINSGTVQYHAASAMSTGSAITVNPGATLALAADANTTFTPASFTGAAGAYTISVNQLTGAGTGKTLSLANAFNAGAGANLTASSTSGDSLQLNNQFTFNNAAATINLSGANLTLNSGVTINGNQGAALTVNAGSNMLTINGNYTTATNRYGTITINSGTVTMANAQNGGSSTNYGIAATLNGGTLNLNNANAIGGAGGGNSFGINGGTINNTSGAAITLARNAPVTLGGNFSFGGSYNLNLGTGSVGLGTAAAATRTITTNGSATLTIDGIISNASNGIAKSGTGTLVLTKANTYAGPTIINGGTLTLSGAGSINSSAITINGSGAKLLQTSSTAVTSGVTLTQGTLAGTGTVGAVTVANASGAIISNGNSNTTALTAASLSFGGAATLNLNYSGTSPALAVTGALGVTPANGVVTINELHALIWTTGQSYNLVSFGSSTASVTDFTLGTVAGLSARQVPALSLTGSNLVLTINGDTPRWDGTTGNNDWTSNSSVTNWKLVNAGTSTYYLASNDAALFDDNASNTTVNILDNSVTPVSVLFNNSTKNYTLTGNGIAGSASLVKNGSGTTTLSNSGNSYTGGTTVSAGTLALSGSGTLGATTGAVTVNSATAILDLGTTSQTSGAVTLGDGIIQNGSLTGASYTLENGTVSANLLGAGALTKTTSGTVVLSGGNSQGYTGTTTISAGTLQYHNSSAMSTASAITIAADATLSLDADANTTFTPASFTGPASGNYAIAVNQLTGAGANKTLTLANANSANTAGTLTVSSTSGDTLAFSSAFSVPANTGTGITTIHLTGANVTLNGVANNTNAQGTGFIVTSTGNNTLTINGNWASNTNRYSIIEVQSGTLIMNNTTTGGGVNWGPSTTLNGGTLHINNNGAVGGAAGGNFLTLTGGTLDNTSGSAGTLSNNPVVSLNGNFAFSGSNDLNLGNGTASLGASAGTARTITTNGTATLAIGGVIANGTTANALIKAGSGTLALTGANTYTGDTTVSAGILTVGGNAIADTNKLVISGGKVAPAGTEVVNSLYFGASQQASGTWGATGSGATHIDDTHFSGTSGVVSVTTGPSGYASWAAEEGLTVGSNDGANQDPDGDGIPNLLEYVLGGHPLTSDASILPTQTLDGTNLTLTFHRSDLSEIDTTQTVQISTGLGTWADFATIGATSSGAVTVTEDSPTAELDTVSVAIPRSNALNGKLFARLNVIKN
ncbi:MAG: autotransporter-associated beta strand repeat-containing protein, partial [Verrucomicrobiota bacterium]